MNRQSSIMINNRTTFSKGKMKLQFHKEVTFATVGYTRIHSLSACEYFLTKFWKANNSSEIIGKFSNMLYSSSSPTAIPPPPPTPPPPPLPPPMLIAALLDAPVKLLPPMIILVGLMPPLLTPTLPLKSLKPACACEFKKIRVCIVVDLEIELGSPLHDL
uniref:Uncharacterized protein n=1 Tax=Glossina austeni TaxID=7395 RepID=A0A1A9URR9_GLOAU